ncbi:hypothetical protein SHJG_3555 [Streptomyces hygroscopicus subsp. jinggangensis 5008]|nr:hypothetical protein SHJG_3555 [Streptomyces hygroscopicus subsp. jinggangensis 5008]AGF62985.1 hypothetical protein SHJGH_3320 [Streptomyces hygroscopicus subsp. jinggangensis TL01]
MRRAPAVPPSLALRHAVRAGEPPHWGREAGSTRRRPAAAAFFRRLRGDLHVALAPGLTPSPGRSGLRTPLLVPIHASRSAQCTAPRGQRRTGFPRGAGGARRPGRMTRTARGAGAGVAAGPARRITRRGAGHNGCMPVARGVRAGESGGVPRCRGTQVDLSSQHDSRARSQYVKGPRPWWRRRPPYSSRRPGRPARGLPPRRRPRAGRPPRRRLP